MAYSDKCFLVPMDSVGQRFRRAVWRQPLHDGWRDESTGAGSSAAASLTRWAPGPVAGALVRPSRVQGTACDLSRWLQLHSLGAVSAEEPENEHS